MIDVTEKVVGDKCDGFAYRFCSGLKLNHIYRVDFEDFGKFGYCFVKKGEYYNFDKVHKFTGLRYREHYSGVFVCKGGKVYDFGEV